MAKILNKKVAIIGGLVFVLLIGITTVLLLRMSKDAETSIIDGDNLFAAGDLDNALARYKEAYGDTKSNSVKVDILYKMVDVYLQQGEWDEIRKCWGSVTLLDPSNVKARLELLDMLYVMADSGSGVYWNELLKQGEAFFDKVSSSSFSEPVPQLISSKDLDVPAVKNVEVYVSYLMGRALYEYSSQLTDVEKADSYEKAIGYFKRAIAIQPGYNDASYYLANTLALKGSLVSSRGDYQLEKELWEEGLGILEQCIKESDDKAEASINLVKLKLFISVKNSLAGFNEIEKECVALTKEYPTDSRVFVRAAGYYYFKGPNSIDLSIENMEQANKLKPGNFENQLSLAKYYYYKYCVEGRDDAGLFAKSLLTAEELLGSDAIVETQSPLRWKHKLDSFSLYEFLSGLYLEYVTEKVEAFSVSDKDKYLQKAKDSIYRIEQLYGSGDSVHVLKWKGLLKYAQGSKTEGIRDLYSVFEQLENDATAAIDTRLGYTLANAFKNSLEQGTAIRFLNYVTRSPLLQWERPEAILDYAEAAIKLGDATSSLSVTQSYEKIFDRTKRSRDLLILSYIKADQVDEAETMLSREDPKEGEVIRLKLSLVQEKINILYGSAFLTEVDSQSDSLLTDAGPNSTRQKDIEQEISVLEQQLAGLVVDLLLNSPELFEDQYVMNVCQNYIRSGQYEDARQLCKLMVERLDDSIYPKYYEMVLAEPNPKEITEERRFEITEQVYMGMSDSFYRAYNLGMFYQSSEKLDKAGEQFAKITNDYMLTGKLDGDVKRQNDIRLSVNYLLDIAVSQENWSLVDKIISVARQYDTDGCGGSLFAAKKAVAKSDPSALSLLNDVLDKRPLFSFGYLYRSNVYAANGDLDKAVEDARKAMQLNPISGDVAKNLVIMLNERNKTLGKSVTSFQEDELKNTLNVAISRNKSDLGLLSAYAGIMAETDPSRAITIRKYLLELQPTVENAILLGSMATRLGGDEVVEIQKASYFKIAVEAFEQAQQIAPDDTRVLYAYANYYRTIGDDAKAEELLKKSENKSILWIFYLQSKDYAMAKNILKELYTEDPKDKSILMGLIEVAQRQTDKESAKRYCGELLGIENTLETRILEIQAYVNVGLLPEAEQKIALLKSDYPGDAKTLYVESWLLMVKGQLVEALAIADRCIEKDKDYSQSWQLRGQINYALGKYEEARGDYDRSKMLFDSGQIRMLQAKTYIALNREEYAIIELKAALGFEGYDASARDALARIYTNMNRTRDLEQLYAEAIEKYPTTSYWYLRAGNLKLASKDYASAEQLFKAGMKQGEVTLSLLNGYFETLLQRGFYDRLFVEAKPYLEQAPYAPMVLMQMADAEKRIGNIDKSLEYAYQAADKVLGNDALLYSILSAMNEVIGVENVKKYCLGKSSSNAESIGLHVMLFNVYLINKEYDNALSSIDKCISLSGSDKNKVIGYKSQKAQLFYQMYASGSDKSYLEKSLNIYESLLPEMPTSKKAELLNNIAYLMASADVRLSEALAYSKQAVELNPMSPDLMDTYAYVLYKTGDNSKADEYMVKARQRFEVLKRDIPWDFYKRMAEIKNKIDSPLQALSLYQLALKTGEGLMLGTDKDAIEKEIERLNQSLN